MTDINSNVTPSPKQDQRVADQKENLRQIVLDTETTGLDAKTDRIIEIGCVELLNRRLTHNNYHQYINPMKEIDKGALSVHGISNEFLSDKPLFGDVVYAFLDFVKGSELVIHNASFDVGFLDAEIHHFDPALGKLEDYCSIVDSLALARELHPGQRNDLNSLAKRYNVDNSHRTLHGALLDSEILADVYLLMSGTQHTLELEDAQHGGMGLENGEKMDLSAFELPVLKASSNELLAHEQMLDNMEKKGAHPIWKQYKAEKLDTEFNS